MDNSINNRVLLEEFVSKIKPDLIERLEISIALCEEVRRFHADNRVHNDINFDAFSIDPTTSSVEISESNLTLHLSEKRKAETIETDGAISGQLVFLSPERTGKTAHPVDFRSDLYSLGIVLYQLLTDTLPFDFDEPLKIIHAHIALPPVPVDQINPKIPPMIAFILSKLLAKSPFDRYQSAAGVIFDLKKALRQLQTNGKIDKFPLGQIDRSPIFEIPNKLYGRYREIQIICDAYEQISEGQVSAVFISGPPGIGKSFLVNNVQSFLLEEGGYFISGKFDQYEKSIPYNAIVQAFSRLILQILTLSDEDLDKVRQAILDAVGQNGQLIIDVIPELELVIGKQPQPKKLSPLENRNRFSYLFKNFVRASAEGTGPIIIFLDDLQWADRTSLELMEAIILNSTLHNVLVIGAYRTIEAKANPFLKDFLENIKQHNPASHQFIALAPVDRDYIETLIKDMLSIDSDHSADVVQLIAQKTNCNPLFIKEFLIHLYKEGLIRFIQAENDSEADHWEIDAQGIFEAKLPETIVALLTQRIRKLSDETQGILKTAACIGTEFSPDLLMTVYKRSTDVIRLQLKEAMDQGIIIRTENGFQFIHDRVREAVYHLNSEEKRTRTHYTVGKALLSEGTEKRSKSIFLLVSQLNSARAQLSADERNELIQLNLVAGKKSKEITAFAIARDYFATGLELLDDSAWENQYEWALALHTEAAETAYMCAEFDEAAKRVKTVLKNARTDLDRLAAYGIRLSCLLSQKRFSEILHEGVHILRCFGYRLPRNPGKPRLLWELLVLKWLLNSKSMQQLKEIDHTLDAKALALNRIISSISSMAYRTRPNLFRFIVLSSLRASLKRGSAPDTAIFFSFYGLLLGALGKIDRGFEFGQLALNLSHHPQISPNSKVQILLPVYGIMLLWKKRFKETLNPLLETYKYCMETGNFTAASSTISIYFNNLVASGAPLKEVFEKIDHYHEIMRQHRQKNAMEYFNSLRFQLVSNFTGSVDSLQVENENGFDEKTLIASLKASNDMTSLSYYYFSKLAGCYFRGNYWEAVKNAELASRILKNSPPSVINMRLLFYDALARIAHIRSVSAAANGEKKSIWGALKFFCLKRYHLTKVAANLSKLRLWSQHAPMNLLNKVRLIEAETASFSGQNSQPEAYYLQAVELSAKYGFLHEEALSSELLARFYLQNSQKKAAEGYFRTAIDLNKKWGAEIQHRRLLMEYRALFAQTSENPTAEITATRRQASNKFCKGLSLAEIELQLFSDVTDTISNKIRVKDCLLSLSEHLMQYFGAQRVLLLINKEKFFVGVDNEIGRKSCVLKPVKTDPGFPDKIIQYAVRTREPVLLDHAARAEIFSTDPYIQSHEAKSVICIPLTYQGRLPAILYMENNLSTGVFTRQHIELLTRLGGQISLFLENEFFKNAVSADGSGFLPPDKLSSVLQSRYGLTPQEAKIAVLFRESHTREEICQILSISATTLRKHLQTIFNKTVNLEEKYTSGGRVDKLSRLILFLFKQPNATIDIKAN